jgi:Family of unknown function (DUF6267)
MGLFLQFLKEEEEGAKLKHITHAEDRPLQSGAEGFEHAKNALSQAHEHIKGGGHSSHLTMKYDGSPSIVFGHHPETGKFFVASKSAFNKNPKINYTHADIAKNHGHAPGLQEKLSKSLDHLKKVAPKKGVYQGDLMFTDPDKKKSKTGVSFTPNTIRYTAKGDEADKVNRAHVGVVVHTQYHGKDIQNMKADPHPDVHNFGHHPDVWLKSAEHDTKHVHYSEHDQNEFQKHIAAAQKIHNDHGKEMYRATSPHQGAGGALETYINHTVRTDEKPSAEGLQKQIKDKYKKVTDKLKTPAAVGRKNVEMNSHLEHIKKNKEHYDNLFKMHDHLQKAKDVLVHTLNQHQGGFEHHVETEGGKYKRTDPEGFVVHHAGEPTKLVNRKEFSKINLLKVRK